MANDTEIEWMRLTFAELNARAAEGALVIVPVASLEQHGPHLATGVDIICANGVAQRVARRMAAAGRAVLKGVVRSAARAGFKRVMLLNGHGGNAEAVAVIAGECQAECGIAVAAGTYWHLAGDAFAPILERQSNVMHACEAETSMVMTLLPDAVRADRLGEAYGPHSTRPEGQPAAMIRRRSFRDVTASGVIGDARSASAEKGEALLEAAAERIADELSNVRLWS